MMQDEEATETRDDLAAKRALAHLFDYETVRRPGDPEQAALAKALSKGFDFKLDSNFQIMAAWFLKERNRALNEIWSESGTEQVKKLKRLKKLIRETATIYNSLPEDLTNSMHGSLLPGPAEIIDSEAEGERAQRYLQKLMNRETPELHAYSGLQILAKYWQLLLPAVDAAIKDSGMGFPQGNKKIDAWRLIVACRSICEIYPGNIEVTESFKSTSGFFRLVSSVFDLFEIDKDPADYFKSLRDFERRTQE